jgi:hypothetical protein
MGKVAFQQFIQKINGPENIVYNQQYNRMVVMPADKQRINAQY